MATGPDARATLRPGDGHVPMAPGPIQRTLATAIEDAAARHPDRQAVRSVDRSLTYAALDRAANRVAHALVDRGVREAEPIGVIARQGPELVVAILGILKAGAAYVPIDPAAPAGRARDVVAIVGAGRLVTDPASQAIAAALVADPVVATAEAGGPLDPPPRGDDPDALAYVYFTSGSTGRPKGVMDTHRNVLDNVRRYTNSLGIGPGDRLSLVQTIAFSGAVSSLFAALVNGATTFPFDVRSAGLAGMREWVAAERLTMFHAVPILFRALTDGGHRFRDLRVVRLEGDAASWSDVERFRGTVARGAVLVNGLGATETGLVRQFFVDHRTPIGTGGLPLGYPVPGVDIRIEEDEIVVVGAHLATGYWGDPDRTARAFRDLGDGRRAYRTGDLGRLEPDGRLVGLGRRDFAEKIRGESVDLAEVERHLRAQPGVADGVAVTRRDGRPDARLVAYVVSSPGRTVDPAVIRRALAAVLPPSSVPSAIVPLPALPLDASSKVDRAALPAPGRGRPDLAVAYRAPGSALERELVALWERLLDVAPVGVDDEFFELGGDSLDAARLVSELEAFAPRHVADDVVLAASTVAALARHLAAAATSAPPPVWYGIHDDPGNTGFYARVALAAAGSIDLRTIGPEAGRPGQPGIDELAAAAVERIRARSPVGPYRVLGFCFSAPIALEVAQRLQQAGHEVAAVALLAISPLEFPGLVDQGSVLAPDRGRYVRQRARAHLAEVRRRGVVGGVGHLADRAAARSGRIGRRLMRRPQPVAQRAAAVRAYAARPFAGRVLVVLGRGSAAVYTHEPDAVWHRLGREVEVVTLPGDDHAMLVEPGATALARALRAVDPVDGAGPDGTLPAVSAGSAPGLVP